MIKKYMLCVCLFVLSFTASAEEWTKFANMNNVVIELHAGHVYFYGTGLTTSYASCPNPTGIFFKKDDLVDGVKLNSDIELNRVLSVGLAAKMASRNMRFYVYGCADINHALARSVEIQ